MEKILTNQSNYFLIQNDQESRVAKLQSEQ
jgi:hypothetical protein